MYDKTVPVRIDSNLLPGANKLIENGEYPNLSRVASAALKEFLASKRKAPK